MTYCKANTEAVSINSVRNFIFGVCGIVSPEMFESNEADSTPSASTGESRTVEDFYFSSESQLAAVKSKFKEMLLYKLTAIGKLKPVKSQAITRVKREKLVSVPKAEEENQSPTKSPL